MSSQVIRDCFTGDPHCFGSCRTEYKNILMNQWLSSKNYKIEYLEFANSGGIGTIGQNSKTIPVHLELGAVLLGVIIILFIANYTIQLTIFLLHTIIQAVWLNIQSSRYLNPHDNLQAICIQSYLMQHSLAPNVLVYQFLQQVQYAADQSFWQPGWTRQYKQRNDTEPCTVLESPLHTLELQDVITIVESSCTCWKWSILFFWCAGAPEIGWSDSVESSSCITQQKQELSLGRCYQGHFPSIGPRF